MPTSAQHQDPMNINFGKEGCGDCGWFSVVDGVMGGKSKGRITIQESSLSLAGTISLENNGGFSSIRNEDGNYDLSVYSNIRIRYRTVGHSFAITLNNHREYYMPRFKHPLPATKGKWREELIALREFSKVRLGETLGGEPTQIELSSIIRFGLISNEKKAGEFELEIDFLKFE